MTDTIEHLQAQLDLRPDDWTLRGVLADCLEEAGSELAAGYRAMAKGEHRAWTSGGLTCYWFERSGGWGFPSHLDRDWYDSLDERGYRPDYKTFPNRRAAEDTAALAFTKLSPARQQELLSGRSGAGVTSEEQ